MASKLLPRVNIIVRRFYTTEKGKNVAFLGLGNMGQYMAANLVKKGYTVRGYDASAESLARAAEAGVHICASIGECVRGAQYVVSALPNNDVVTSVYLDKDGVVQNAEKGALLIDSSTVEPAVSQRVGQAARGRDLAFVDAPMSGGVMGAKNATLAFMLGGAEIDVERAKPVLSALGVRQVHCGPVGAGEVAKLCNNMIMAINMMGTAECMNLGIRMGLQPAALLEVINGSSGRSWCSEVYCPVPGLIPTAPSSASYEGGFKNALLVKDLNLASSIATSSKSPTPLGALTTQIYKLIQTHGRGEEDFSYVYQFIKEQQKI